MGCVLSLWLYIIRFLRNPDRNARKPKKPGLIYLIHHMRYAVVWRGWFWIVKYESFPDTKWLRVTAVPFTLSMVKRSVGRIRWGEGVILSQPPNLYPLILSFSRREKELCIYTSFWYFGLLGYSKVNQAKRWVDEISIIVGNSSGQSRLSLIWACINL